MYLVQRLRRLRQVPAGQESVAVVDEGERDPLDPRRVPRPARDLSTLLVQAGAGLDVSAVDVQPGERVEESGEKRFIADLLGQREHLVRDVHRALVVAQPGARCGFRPEAADEWRDQMMLARDANTLLSLRERVRVPPLPDVHRAG